MALALHILSAVVSSNCLREAVVLSKVLIIDDDAVLRELLETSLSEVRHDVKTVSNETAESREVLDAVLDEIERPFSLNKLEHRLRLLGLTERR